MTDSLIRGTSTIVPFSRVVDGDTIKIFRSADVERDESVRILCLDTEESFSAGSKPVTPWGREAKTEAERFFQGANEVTIEFPGNDPVTEAFDRYRGNFGRLLVFVYYDGVDFQEYMIRNGYSPYFNKYGNAVFSSHHRRYQRAERAAQRDNIGVWNQIAVNGSVIRDYPKLTAWWTLRADIIDEYRKLRETNANVYNTRMDYDELKRLAEDGDKMITVFTEVRDLRRINRDAAIISIGARERPFNLYIPNVDTEEGDKIVRLFRQRYISRGEDNPKRSYCYVTGLLNTFRGNPQIVVTNEDDIADSFEK